MNDLTGGHGNGDLFGIWVTERHSEVNAILHSFPSHVTAFVPALGKRVIRLSPKAFHCPARFLEVRGQRSVILSPSKVF